MRIPDIGQNDGILWEEIASVRVVLTKTMGKSYTPAMVINRRWTVQHRYFTKWTNRLPSQDFP